MLKPNNYDSITTYSEFKNITVGGHIMVIQSVEETVSKAGNPMLIINLDTAPDDTQPGYFMERWKSDTRPKEQKRWGCVVYQLVTDRSGDCHRGLKTFLESVEASNPGFTVQWGDMFCTSLKSKKVGGIFRREQYENAQGELKWSTKCFSFRSVQKILDGVEIPADKYLDGNGKSGNQSFGGFEELDEDSGELPFN